MKRSQEVYDSLSSGKWLLTLLKLFQKTGRSLDKTEDLEFVANRAATHFQELFNTYNECLAQEESEDEAERVRVLEDLEVNPDKISEYRIDGWSVTRRAKKSLDLDLFIEDHEQDIPKEALAVVKAKLPKHLQKELVKYESVQGYTFSVKRSKTED